MPGEGFALDVSSYVHFGDPIMERVRGKTKKYGATGMPMHLLAYYRKQDSLSLELIRDNLIAQIRAQQASPFTRVWIYFDTEKQILRVEPDWEDEGGRFEPFKREL
jgi:hypothetical protein